MQSSGQIATNSKPTPNVFLTGRMPFLSPNQQRQSAEGKSITFHRLVHPKFTWGLPNLSLTTKGSWLPWGRVSMSLVSPLIPEPRLSPFWILLKQDDGGAGDNWSYETCKSPVKLSLPTKQHPVFLQAGCPSCRQSNSLKALKKNTF